MELIGRWMKPSVLFALASSLLVPGAFAHPDLAVVKSGPATAAAGDLITYTLVYTNQGQVTDPGATLTDVLPPQLAANTNNLGGGTLNSNMLTWNLGPLNVGDGGTKQFQVQVGTNATVGESITNISYILGSFPTGDLNPLNNTSLWVTVCTSCVPAVLSSPTNQTICPNEPAQFSVTAVGALAYQWYFDVTNLLSGRTQSNLSLSTVGSTNAGVYSVVVSGACGVPITNSATLTVLTNVSVLPLSDAVRNVGDSITFTAIASGTGPYSYQWYKGANPLSGQTNSTLTLTNLQFADAGTYTAAVTGACGEAVDTSAILIVHQPPTVQITYPTNGSVFIAPATFTVIASAQAAAGNTVTNVSFFSSTNAIDFSGIGQKATAPYFTVVSNLPVSQYTFTATAVDNLGATGVSAPVTVNVISQPLFTTSALYFGSDGYVHMNAVVSNTTPVSFAGLRIYIYGVTNPVTVANATGTTNGVPYIEWDSPVLSGATLTNNIKFYVPVGGYTPNVTLQVVVITPPAGGAPPINGTPQAIDHGLFQNNGTFLVQFTSRTNRIYYIQYSSNLLNWNTVLPSIQGNGTKILWVDSGPPETITMPSLANPRYYRVVWVP